MNKQHTYRATVLPIPEGTKRPLWSVMIPTYNCAHYLRETLSNVLAQDPGADVMQIAVIDDHSTKDDPKSVVEELGQGRVEFYQQPQNVGFIKNFETCLQRARGYLIHQLHGDDYVCNGFYKKIQQAFDEYPEVGATFCRSIYMNQEGHWQTISGLEQPTTGVLSDWLEKIATRQRIATPSIVVRRDVYEHLGGFDSRIMCCGEDWEMWVRIATEYQVAYIPEPLAVYRFKPIESLSPLRIQQIMQDMRLATEIIASHLTKHFSPQVTKEILKNARSQYADWPIEAARMHISNGDFFAGIKLLQESRRSSHSLRIGNSIMRAFIKASLKRVKVIGTSAMTP